MPHQKTKKNTVPWVHFNSATLAHGQLVDQDIVVQHLQRELDTARRYNKTMLDEHSMAQEELKSSQEKLLFSNNGFQKANQALQAAKEQLVSANDVLMHRNKELNALNTELEQARNYAYAIVETVREPLVVLDENLRIVRTNAAFYNTFRLTPHETLGCLFYELDHQQWDIPMLRQLLNEILSKDEAFESCEITSEFAKIGKKTMMLNGKHMAWDNQALILLAIEDVTDYKAAQDELKEAARRKDEFLAMLAHELRNPLAPIRNALEIWRRGDAGEQAEQQAQIVMDRQLRKETRLIDDLLDVARITQGSIVLKAEVVDLREIASQAVEGTQHQYCACNHSLVLELPEAEVMVEGDPVRLEQIISNLLTNAAKYTEPGGHIVLSLERVETHAVLRVVDNGIGINPEMLPRIFDLFVQAEVSLARSQGGLGIGLTLVRRLVELQGGIIEAHSRGANEGSEFVVRLPIASAVSIADVRLSSDAPAEPSLEARPLIHRRILVVDDNLDSANTSALLLQLEGHEVRAAYSGPEALEIASYFEPEIILMDIGLPGMDGYEAARRIREMPNQGNVLLIAVSGYGPRDEGARTNALCFDHHLMKPVILTDLRKLVADFEPDKAVGQ